VHIALTATSVEGLSRMEALDVLEKVSRQAKDALKQE
jgi:hypothetical protein